MKKLTLLLIFVVVVSIPRANATVPPKQGEVPHHLRAYLEKIRSEYGSGYWAQQMKAREAGREKSLNKSSLVAPTDTVNVPILMGRYSNSTNIYATSVFQQELFDGPNPTGTMTDFYLENSYGKLYMTGKVMGWFTLSRASDYYIKDGGQNAGLNYGGRDFTIDILVAADQTIDFSKFVKYVDGQGAHVPQLGVIHTGGDAASGAANIWSHRWNIQQRLLQRKSSGTETIVDVSRILSDGKYLTNDSLNGKPVIIDGDYTIQPELLGSSNSSGNPKSIGVFTHEFGHIFGLPDLYDTDNSSAGLGNWCLMAGGSYGGDGAHEATPAHMSAWCKEKLGWVTPVVVSAFMPHHMINYVEKYPEIYKCFYRGASSGEYFLIENRQKAGFDQYLISGGLLIFHVDPSVSTGNTNENHYLVDLEQADGRRGLNTSTGRGDDGDPFPGSTNNHTFDGYTNPNSTNYASAQSFVGVRKISNSDTVMYADLDIGTRPYVNINSLVLSEAGSNNGNGRVDPGETGTFTLNLLNAYPIDLTNAKVSISAATNDEVIDTTSKFVSITGLSTVPFVMTSALTVKPASQQRLVQFTVNVQSSLETFSKTFDVLIGYPKILLVAVDSLAIENNQNYYLNALQRVGRFSEQARVGVQSLQAMSFDKRDVIIYYTGRKTSQTIPDSVGESLKIFLDNGGKVFLTGQNIAEDLTARNSSLQTQLIHASWSKNIVFGRNLYGVVTDKIGDQITRLQAGGFPGAGNQVSPDEIKVDTLAAHPSLLWNSQTGTSYGGLWWENPAKGSKLVFWSFGFEAIDDSAAGANTQSQAMATVLNWFYGITSTPELSNKLIAPASFTLHQNYPNPFNPTTHFQFTVPGAHQPSAEIGGARFVSLKIYDALGRETATLVSQPMNAGTYTVRWDATNFPSGVYFYRLTAGGFSETKKLSLIK